MSKNVGVYIHIPFCKKKCYYCDFTSFECKNEIILQYIGALKNEIAVRANDHAYSIKTIYIGGGTPSYIDSNYIKEIIDTIRQNYSLNKLEEVTIEINPGAVTKEKLEEYKDMGINRISIGLQSTKNELLEKIGRIHNYEEFLNTYNITRKAGFTNINVDIMFGLPEQTLDDVDETINKIINLNPEHISTYSLILEEETSIYKMQYTYPDEETERKMYWLIKRKLEDSGYIHYEISNFAKPRILF